MFNRFVLCALLLAGCRQVLGIDTPALATADAEVKSGDGSIDAVLDAVVCPDDDHDGVCNDFDDWPCGAKPVAPPTSYELENSSHTFDFKLSNISISSLGTLAVLNVGDQFSIDLHLIAASTSLVGAQAQLEFGLMPTGLRTGCLFDSAFGLNATITTDIAKPVTTPMTPGAYTVLVNIGQANSCGTTTGWYGLAQTIPITSIAQVCVH